jgi:two-component system, OmpR family, KDP operon response regulator KdpE
VTDRILVCDPDPDVQRALQLILRGAGYEVLIAGTGKEALDCVAASWPQAVILELTLPDLGGIELCRRLRARGEVPILVLSAVGEETAKIEALGSGADDYVTKPFGPGELVARLGARLRSAAGAATGPRFEGDGLVIDLAAHLVTIDGEEVHLTPTEFALLRALATSNGPVTYPALAAELREPLDSETEPWVIAARVRRHIAGLRAKLDADHRRNLIRTEVGIGYRFAGLAQTSASLVRTTTAGP